MLDAGIVDAGHVGGGEDAHDARDGERGGGVEPRHAGVGVGCLDGVGVEQTVRARREVVGVERSGR